MERQKKMGYQPPTRHKNIRHGSVGNQIYDIYNTGSRRLNRISNTSLFFWSLLAGAFMCLGSLLSILLMTDVAPIGVQSLLSSLGLTIGFLLVILTNTTLFTEANIFVPTNFYNVTTARGCLRLFRFWFFSWLGNVIGAFLLAFLIYLAQQYPDNFRQNLTLFTTTKLLHADGQTLRGTFELIVSGMLANWLIALVGFFALASRNLVNQFIIIFVTFVAIIATNFQYFPVNLSYLALNTFLGSGSISLLNGFFYNLIPVSLGNILGASILAAGPLLGLSKKRQSTHIKK